MTDIKISNIITRNRNIHDREIRDRQFYERQVGYRQFYERQIRNRQVRNRQVRNRERLYLDRDIRSIKKEQSIQLIKYFDETDTISYKILNQYGKTKIICENNDSIILRETDIICNNNDLMILGDAILYIRLRNRSRYRTRCIIYNNGYLYSVNISDKILYNIEQKNGKTYEEICNSILSDSKGIELKESDIMDIPSYIESNKVYMYSIYEKFGKNFLINYIKNFIPPKKMTRILYFLNKHLIKDVSYIIKSYLF